MKLFLPLTRLLESFRLEKRFEAFLELLRKRVNDKKTLKVRNTHLQLLLRQLVKEFLGLGQRGGAVPEERRRGVPRVPLVGSGPDSPVLPAQLGASLRPET